jgi:hypothetical protein
MALTYPWEAEVVGAAFERVSFFFFSVLFSDGGTIGAPSGGNKPSFTGSLDSVVAVFSELTLGFFGGGGGISPSSLVKQIRLHQQHI